MDSFRFTDTDFNDFVNWVEKKGFDFNTETESAFAKAFKTAEKEELDDDINSSYKAMQEAINNAKKKDMKDKKAEIMSLLTDEIVKRYFYRDGLYNYQLKFNPEILEAVNVLEDQNKYNRILK